MNCKLAVGEKVYAKASSIFYLLFSIMVNVETVCVPTVCFGSTQCTDLLDDNILFQSLIDNFSNRLATVHRLASGFGLEDIDHMFRRSRIGKWLMIFVIFYAAFTAMRTITVSADKGDLRLGKSRCCGYLIICLSN